MAATIRNAVATVSLLCIALLTSSVTPAAASVLVTGRVTTVDTHQPIPAATVSLYHGKDEDPVATTQTLQNGAFILRVPTPGDYHLRVDHRLYLSEDRPQTIAARGTAPINFTLAARPVIHLKLITPDGAQLMKGDVDATIHITFKGDQDVNSIPSDTLVNGLLDVTFDHVVPTDKVDDVHIYVRAADEGCGDVEIDSWPTAPLSLKLDPGSTLVGTATDAAGKPIPAATVIAFRMFNSGKLVDFAQRGVTNTDAAGKFRVGALPHGMYGIYARSATTQSDPYFVLLNEPETSVDVKVNKILPVPPEPAAAPAANKEVK